MTTNAGRWGARYSDESDGCGQQERRRASRPPSVRLEKFHRRRTPSKMAMEERLRRVTQFLFRSLLLLRPPPRFELCFCFPLLRTAGSPSRLPSPQVGCCVWVVVVVVPSLHRFRRGLCNSPLVSIVYRIGPPLTRSQNRKQPSLHCHSAAQIQIHLSTCTAGISKSPPPRRGRRADGA